MGKSATGKDTIFRELLLHDKTGLKKIIPYTTRPIREGEQNGKEYFFCSEAELEQLSLDGKVIELRVYHTVYGDWKYFTVDDGQIELDKFNYLLIGTLDTYQKIQKYYGKEQVLPIYIEVEDGERLMRAIARERQQSKPKYAEMCRRFLADCEDFSEERLAAAGITQRFSNIDLVSLAAEISSYIRRSLRGRYLNGD